MAVVGWMEQGWIGACGNGVWVDGGRKGEWEEEWWRVAAQMEERHEQMEGGSIDGWVDG